MEIEFQLLDVDYVFLENRPIIRILGKTNDGKTVCAFYDKFYPYFYVLPKKEKEEDVVEDLKKNFFSELKNIEKVKRYLPIGFNEEKVEMLKITLKDPSKTATIREHLRKKDFVEDIFEADILFKYRFMADFSLFGMSWYKVSGNPIRTESVKADITIEMEKIEPIEKIENAPLKYMALDIEVVSEGIANPQEAPIAIISLSFFPAFNGKNTLVLVAKNNMKKIDQDVLTFKDEKEMLEKFLEIIDTFDPDIIVGYNINDFDIPYINERLKINKMRRTIGRCTEKQLVSRSLGENRYKNSVFGRIIVDPYWMIKDMAGRGFFTGLKRFSLEDVSQYLLGEGKVEFSYKDMPIAWNGNEEQMKKFIDYARRDSELVLRLLLEKQLLDKYIGISKVSGLLLQDSLDTGEAGKVENLLLREFDKDGFVLPCKPTDKEIARRKAERDIRGFKGAFVLEPEVGLHTNCVAYLDFACHPLGTKVVVKGIGEKDISEVKEGEFVLGKNGWHKVVKKWEYDYKGYLVNINGLRCTPNHKIPVLKENERQKFVRDVTAISLFKNKAKGKPIFLKEFGNIGKIENKKTDEKYVLKSEFLGIFLAEGTLQRRDAKYFDKQRKKTRVSHQYRVEIAINIKEAELAERIRTIFKKLWDISPYEIKDRDRSYLLLATGKKRVFFEVENLLKEIKKFDPKYIVRGFFEGDGTVNCKRRTIVMNQSYGNKWKLDLIANFLDDLEIGYKRYEYQLKDGRKICILEIARREDIVKFFTLVGAISKLKASKLEHIIEKKEFSHSIGEKFYEAKNPEFSLEYYEGKVYDLTLNSEPYYFANGILTHNSMYPSIFISYNICPTTLLTEKKEGIEAITTPFGTSFVPPSIRKGIIPKTVERLIKERNAVKTQMKAEKDPVKKRALDAYQEGLKRIANASYGYTGFLLGRIYVLSIANAITSCGRYYIQETKRLVETNTNYKVIYGDTDSVMIKTDTQDIEKAIEIGNNIANFLNEKLQGKLKIKVENIFKTLLILTKKRYAGWSFEKIDSQFKDEIVMKGIETVRRDWCDLVSETQEEVLKILLKEQNPKKAFAYFKEVVQKLQSGQIPLEKLTIIKGISKRPEQYKGVQPHVELVKKMRKRGEVEIPSIGDRVGFVIVKGLQLVSERAEDPEYVKKHNLKIDSKYYIESQLLPPLERVFEAIGINKSELIGLGKQMLLGEAINNHKKTEEKPLTKIEGVVCVKCNTTFRRVPLIGRCPVCGGELEFYFGEERAKILSF
jgi:DNA polymerase I